MWYSNVWNNYAGKKNINFNKFLLAYYLTIIISNTFTHLHIFVTVVGCNEEDVVILFNVNESRNTSIHEFNLDIK